MPRETLTEVKAQRDEALTELAVAKEKALRLEALVDMIQALLARARGA